MRRILSQCEQHVSYVIRLLQAAPRSGETYRIRTLHSYGQKSPFFNHQSRLHLRYCRTPPLAIRIPRSRPHRLHRNGFLRRIFPVLSSRAETTASMTVTRIHPSCNYPSTYCGLLKLVDHSHYARRPPGRFNIPCGHHQTLTIAF